MQNDIAFSSPLLPGGNLVAALLDRTLMRLSDRGGASGLIGDRWADLCARQLAGWVGGRSGQAGHNGATIQVEQVVRLDDLPQLVMHASRQKLQSPDFLILGRVHGEPVIQAADAKFSVETARSRQVSTDVLADLLAHLPELQALLTSAWIDAGLVPGVFLCPDYSLTSWMLRGQRGVRRVSVQTREIALLPVAAGSFTAPLTGAALMTPLASIDNLPLDPDRSLLTGLYYFRLARACVTCWIDETRPFLGPSDREATDLDQVGGELLTMRPAARSAFGLVLAWQRRAERVQEDRERVERAASLPIPGKELRALIEALGAEQEGAAPSVNQVRRKLGAWYQARLIEAIGPVKPPVADLDAVLRSIRKVAASLHQATRDEAAHLVARLTEERQHALAAGELALTQPEA